MLERLLFRRHAPLPGQLLRTGDIGCRIDNVTNVTANYWGTTDPAVIDAAICGADLAFVPF
jgi:hypothetical protein